MAEKFLDQNIDSDYKYSSKVIKQGLNWNTDIRSGIFLYSNGDKRLLHLIRSRTYIRKL